MSAALGRRDRDPPGGREFADGVGDAGPCTRWRSGAGRGAGSAARSAGAGSRRGRRRRRASGCVALRVESDAGGSWRRCGVGARCSGSGSRSASGSTRSGRGAGPKESGRRPAQRAVTRRHRRVSAWICRGKCCVSGTASRPRHAPASSASCPGSSGKSSAPGRQELGRDGGCHAPASSANERTS